MSTSPAPPVLPRRAGVAPPASHSQALKKEKRKMGCKESSPGFFATLQKTFCPLAESFSPLGAPVHLPREVNRSSANLSLPGKCVPEYKCRLVPAIRPGFNCTKAERGSGFHPVVACLTLQKGSRKGAVSCVPELNLKAPEQGSERLACFCSEPVSGIAPESSLCCGERILGDRAGSRGSSVSGYGVPADHELSAANRGFPSPVGCVEM